MPSPRAHAAKVGHRKSRNGCLKCKARRVKVRERKMDEECDEVQPVCGNCTRLGMSCRWPEHRRRPASSASPRGPSSSQDPTTPPPPQGRSAAGGSGGAGNKAGQDDHSSRPPPIAVAPDSVFSAILHRWPVDAIEDTVFGSWQADESGEDGGGEGDDTIPESRERRLLEHRLLHNYYTSIANPFPVSPSEEWSSIWTHKLPALALHHDNLLHAMLSVSATHLLREQPGDVELFTARQRYLISAMREQRRMLATLTARDADAVCFGALKILMNSFATLRERQLDPYEPPMDWLRLGRGAGTVIWMSVAEAARAGVAAGEPDAPSGMMLISDSYPRIGWDESYFAPEMRSQFEGVLTQKLPSGDAWHDAESREAYEKALSYVGSVQRAIDRGEPVYAVCRRIQAFALVVPPKFIDFVMERRPRALVVLAHFFAVVAQVRGVWWLGESRGGGNGGGSSEDESMARREIRAISHAIPAEWHGQMVWPLDTVGLR